jgi:large subunit ribosomal protein L18
MIKMAEKRTKVVPYRRKREGKTNYKKRLKLLVSGVPRIVVRKTNKHIIVQVVNYSENGDSIVVTANSSQLKKLGWNFATGNLPAAYLTGLLAGRSALSKNIKNAIVDLGLQTPSHGSRLYAAVKGVIDAGLEVPCSEEALPGEDRISGKHIVEYAKVKKPARDTSGMDGSFSDLKSKIMKK